MNKIRNYWKNKKGITLVWGAFFLVLCLMFLGLAADIAYMYVVKNQLQVAGDAASLAGAAMLTLEVDNTADARTQDDARQEAWRFACKNKAADNPRNVYLVATDPDANDPAATDDQKCDNIPSDLNNTNLTTGDIVVGHWSSTPIPCPSTGLTEKFCPANGLTNLTINALRATPKRTDETPGMPKASLFIGKVFGWSVMSARADSIAAFFPAKILPISVNEYWLQRDASKRPYPTAIHQYPSSFVRKTNVDGTSSQAWGRIFGILGAEASDNIPQGTPGSQNVNGFVQMDFRSSYHSGLGGTWYEVNKNVVTNINCSNCPSGFIGPTTKNNGFVQSAKFNESLQYLYNGYDYILPTSIKERYRGSVSNYPADSSIYPIPTSECPFATLPYFSGGGITPINKDVEDKYPKGKKIITLVYDGTFIPDVTPNMPNAITQVGYVLLHVDGYGSANPKNLDLDKSPNKLRDSGNTMYAHALSDIVEPASSFGTCDETFFRRIRDLQRIGGEVKLVK